MTIHLAFRKRARSLLQDAICLWTGGPYFHCALWFDQHDWIEALGAPGVHQVVVPSLGFPSEWDLLEIPSTPEEEAKMRAFLAGELGCGYDWWGVLIAQVFGIHRASKTKWFCSELCVAALQAGGLMPGAEPCHFNPNSLYDFLAPDRENWAR